MTNDLKTPLIRGFSLIELLIVLVIAGLFVTLSRPLYEAAIPGAKHRKETRELMTALRDSASRSIMTGSNVDVRIATEPASYSVDGHAPNLLTSELSLNIGGNSSDTATVVFHPDGSSNGALIDVRGKVRTYRIVVDWLTSDVRLSEHHEIDIEI